MRPVALALLGVLAACGDPPPLTVRFRVTPGDASACFNSATPPAQVTTCSDVQMLCEAVVSIRVASPADPSAPYINVCQQLTTQQDLCAIASVDLSTPIQPIPVEDLEVDIAVFPLTAVPVDMDPSSTTFGQLLCPQVDYDATGFPVTSDMPCDPTSSAVCPVVPAVGGRAYYHPGDPETLVDLGCTDLTQLDGAQCIGANKLDVTAAIDDFDTEVSVQSSLANALEVSVGEPIAVTDPETHYVLDTANTSRLTLTASQPVPVWGANISSTFVNAACLEVLEDGGQTTATLVCEPVTDFVTQGNPATTHADITGIRLAKSTLSDVLGAISEPQFPDSGLVIGIVLDYLGNPVANLSVTTTAGSVRYLSSDRHNIILGGTSSNGIFVSEDAPFGTTFSASSSLHTVSRFGGLVDGKVTVVVLQFDTPVGGS